MKKLGFMFVAILILCFTAAAIAGMDFSIPSVQDAQGRAEMFHSIVATESTVYLLSGRNNLYALDVESQTAALIPIHNANPEYERIPEEILAEEGPIRQLSPNGLAVGIDRLLGNGQDLYGLNSLTGAFYQVEISGGHATLRAISVLDFSVEPGQERSAWVECGAVCDGALYLVMTLSPGQSAGEAYRFDMSTGLREPLADDGSISEITGYQENRLLFLEKDGPAEWRITAFDPATEARTLLFDGGSQAIPGQNLGGLIYDRWRDRILIQSSEKILAITGAETYQLVCNMQPSHLSYCRDLLPDGTLILALGSLYGRCILEEKPVQRTLRIACGDLSFAISLGFAQDYPEIVIEHRLADDGECASLFAEHMNLQSDEIDIYALPVGLTTQRAFEKGYYHALNSIPSINRAMEGYWPFVAQALLNHGEIAAVPRAVTQNTLAYSRYALEQLGLAAQDMPSSFEGLLDFLLAWDNRVGDIAVQADITPFEITHDELKPFLLWMLLDQYEARMEDGTPGAIQEADLARLLDKLSLSCDSIPEGPGVSIMAKAMDTGPEYTKYQVNDQPAHLFTLNGSFLPGWRNFSYNYESVSDFVPLNLALFEGDQAILLFDGTAFVVNPFSSQKEKAANFLGYYVEHFPAKEAAAFIRDAKPLESELYQIMGYRYTAEIDDLREQITAADAITKKELEIQLKLQLANMRSREQIRWDISERALREYKLALHQAKAFWLSDYDLGQAFNLVCRQYFRGEASGGVLAKAIFDTYKMVFEEAR